VRPAGSRLLQFSNQAIDLRKKDFSAGEGLISEDGLRMLSDAKLLRLPCPPADIEIGNHGESAQIAAPAGVPKVRQQILKAQLQGHRRSTHDAVQHETAK
jgi:hypothetical protein